MVAQKIKEGKHNVRANPSHQDELGVLVNYINDMLDVLCESELRFRQLAENIHEVFWITTPNKDQALYISPAYELIWGRTLESLSASPQDWLNAIHPEDRHWVQIAMSTKQLTGQYDEEYRVIRPNGEVRWIHDQAFPVRNAAGEVYRLVGVAEDITEHKQSLFRLKVSEERLDFLAHHDPLTRLPNRLLMNTRLESAIEHAQNNQQKLALLVLDLDRFKNINDSFGHTMGDEVLQKVASRLSIQLHGADNLCRLGGDEFTILLENNAVAEASQIAADLIETINNSYTLSTGIQVSIGLSVGISLFPEHGHSATELFQHADIALYRAKEEGRGRYQYFSEEMSVSVRARIDLENRLREALDAGHLCVYYQPQVEIKTGNIVGAEALVRWQDPQRGLISPAQFIAVAEDSGLIDRIGHFVLLETCLQGQRWLQAGYAPIVLAVNLSPRQTQHSSVTAMVTEVLQKTHFPAEHLELELTESALMKHESDVIDMLNYLRSLGVRLAIDDFGTGYSSLSYLKRFPLDVLKVDKSFVDDIPNHPDGMELVATIINMGHTLGFKVLAEGVETEAQRHFLRIHQCDMYQGYLTSKPIPPDQFEQQFLRMQ
jgi:diguanylate cyclase (GGDEF)-like protein/PAS domain S-box-containing protein